jgi:hypothetical protein
MEDGCASLRWGGGGSRSGCGVTMRVVGGAPAPGMVQKANAAIAARTIAARDTVFISFNLCEPFLRSVSAGSRNLEKASTSKKGGIAAAPDYAMTRAA